jgi:peptidyl-prolyl cis-trans isomerase D
MISWIQKTFQQHFRSIFAVLLGVIIISFVFTIGAAPGIGDAQKRGLVDRYFFGYNLSLQRDQEKLMGDASLSASLRVGFMSGLSAEQIQNYAFQRAAALHLADQWHIPGATPSEIEAQIKTLRMFAGQDGQFDPKSYQNFRDRLKTDPRGTTEADVARVVSDDVRMEKVQKLIGGPGYVLPADIKSQIARADTSWTLGTATTAYADYKPEIKPTDAELTAFFEQAGGRYDIPPRVVLGVANFTATDFIAQVQVKDAEVRAFYDANPSRFPKPAEKKDDKPATPNVTPAADANADFAAVRAQVEATLKVERAQKLAAKAASDMSLALFEAKAATTEAAEKYLAAKNIAVKTLAPFTRDNPPAEFGGSFEAVNEAFRLNKDRAVSDALSTATGAVILLWKETQPSRKPAFAEVREKVQTDYVDNEKRKRFVDLGRTAKAEIEARLKAGDAFEKAVASAGTKAGLKLDLKMIAPFTLRSRPQDLDFTVLGALETLEKGQVSDMAISGESGVFVFAADKKVPDVNDSDPRFVETRTQLATYSSQLSASAYLSDLVEQELKKSEPKTKAKSE